MLNQKRNQAISSRFVWLLFASALLLIGWPLANRCGAQESAGFRPLDLTNFYTDSETNKEPLLPRGKRTFDGVPFILDRRLELTGMNAARAGEFLPSAIARIPVNGRAARIHLLMGARHGQKDGVPMANLLLEYKSGQILVLRLAYGIHARNSFGTNDVPNKKLGDPNATVAWEQPPDVNGASARLYHVILANPLPEEEISSVGFTSLFSAATPIVFSVTLQNGANLHPLSPLPKNKLVQRAFQFDDSTYRRQLTVRVTEPSGKALSNASAVVTLQDDSKSYFFGQYRSDKNGLVSVPYPPQEAVGLGVRVSVPGLVPSMISLSSKGGAQWPDTMDVTPQHGTGIGGFVVDDAGHPVSNASVIPFHIRSTGSNEYTRTDLDTAVTRADGTWSTIASPEVLTNLSFEVAHPDYHRRIVDSYPAADLVSSRAKTILQPHILLAGQVLNEKGNPLPHSTVILDLGSNHTWQYTDAKGRYKFVVQDPTNTTAALISFATNYAPVLKTVSVRGNQGPVDLSLKAGEKLSMRLVDQENRPVPKVKVSLSSWGRSKAMQWRTETDKNGRFTWDHAPEGQVTFRFEKPGYTVLTHSMTSPGAGENLITYSRRVTVAGRVVDGETQKPIDQFRARVRYKYANGNGSGSTSTTGRRGSFSYYLGGNKYQEVTVLIEARGFQPVGATLTADENGAYSNLFLLKKAIPLPGFVVTPDGTPAAGAEVVLLDKNSYAYMEEPGRFRRGYSDYEVAVTDDNGRFELTPKLEPDFVLAAHRTLGFGQIRASELSNGAKLQLKPWGHIKGVLKVGEKVEAYHYVAVHSANSYSSGPDELRQTLYTYLKVKPEPDGRFSFDAVPPGQRTVNLRYQFQEKRDYGPMRVSHTVPLEVKPGETNEVVIGGTGRTVTGKLECTGTSAQLVDWQLYAQTLRPVFRPASMVRPRIPGPNATAEERQRINQEYQKAIMGSNRMQQRQNNITYVLVCDADGSFKVPNLPAGQYYLNATAVVPSGTGGYRHVGNLQQTVTVPDGTAPYDLGKFVVKGNQ